MHKQPILYVCLLLIYGTAIAGIYRHDRKESEYVALGAQPQFDCVGKLLKGGAMHASCVLISDRYILTAAHIFIEASYRDKQIRINDSTTFTANEPYNEHIGDVAGYTAVFNGKEYKCKKLITYPRYLDSSTHYGLDVAILELETPVTGVAPAILSNGYDELHADVTGVGWGVYGRADKPAELVKGEPKKLGGENVIDSIGGYRLNGHPTYMFCDFDHPTDTSCNKMGSPIPRDLEYISSGGDSGGGLFRKTSSGWQLIGICHGASINVTQMIKTGYYGQVMSWMRVSVFADWVKENEK